MTRTLLTSLGVALLSTAGCGGSPAAPSSSGAAIVGDTSTVQREVRGDVAGKKPESSPVINANALVICHRDGNTYRPIEVNPNDEQTHLGHGDARPGELVPADHTRVFDVDCRLISPVEIEKFTNGQDADQAPGPTIPVGSPVNWTYVVTNRSALVFTSLSVTDDRGVSVACPRTMPASGQSVTCTGSGVAAAGQYRNVGTVTVTANGNSFTASNVSYYFGGVVGVTIEKFTNGGRVSRAPGPRIPVGSTVIWTYVITNRSASVFTSLTVTDDRGVAVACPTLLPAPGQSVTCTGSGVAVAGQYRNVGTAVATGDGNRYTNSDESFYFGGGDEDEDENEGSGKVELCHRTGNGSYHLINVSVNAETAHRAHGDAKVGEAVPGSSGRVFTASCTVQ